MRGKGLPRTLAKLAVAGMVAAALPIALTAGPVAAAATAYSSAPGTSLGVPLTDVLLINGTVGTMSDGRRVIWSASSGTPAILNAVDPTIGAPLLSAPLPGAELIVRGVG